MEQGWHTRAGPSTASAVSQSLTSHIQSQCLCRTVQFSCNVLEHQLGIYHVLGGISSFCRPMTASCSVHMFKRNKRKK